MRWTDGHEARELGGRDVEKVARRRLGNDQDVAVGARHDVHEGERDFVLGDAHARRLAAQDLGENVVGIVRLGHGLSGDNRLGGRQPSRRNGSCSAYSASASSTAARSRSR